MEQALSGVSVIVPVYGNQETLKALHEQLREVFMTLSLNYQLVYVNDASPDGSAEILSELALAYPKEITVVTHAHNQGQHLAVLQGLEHATMPLSIVMDGDLQDQPEHIPNLIQALQSPYEAVYLKRDDLYQGWARMLTSRSIKLVVYALTGLHFKAGMYFVLSRQARERVLQMPRRHAYVSIMVASTGLPFTYVSGSRVKRYLGKSAYTFRKRVIAATKAMRCWWACRRYKVIG